MRDRSWHCGTGTARLEWQCVKWKPLSITLQSALCSVLSWLLPNLWVMLSSADLLLFFFFFINLVLKCFLKAGSSAELPFFCFCLEHKCSRSQKCGTKEVLKWGSEFWVILLCCVSSGLHSVERSLPGSCLWEQMNSGESRAKCDTTWGSSHYSIPQHCLVTEAKTAALPCS